MSHQQDCLARVTDKKGSESPTMHLNGHNLAEKLYWVTTAAMNTMTQHYRPCKTVRLEQCRRSTFGLVHQVVGLHLGKGVLQEATLTCKPCIAIED